VPDANAQAVRACLALHGLGGGPYEFGDLFDALRRAGLVVAAPTLPGHDGPGPTMPASRWEDWSAAATEAFDGLTRAVHGGPVAVLGFSTGATLALHLTESREPARLVLLAPFLAIRFSALLPIPPRRYLPGVAAVTPDIPRRAPAARDPEARRRAAAHARFRTFSLPSTISALDLIERVTPRVPTIATPTLILQGRRDTVVEPRRAGWLARHLGAEDRRLVWLERSDHLLALDRDRDRVADEVVRFLAAP
jgi:carboxylesterase